MKKFALFVLLMLTVAGYAHAEDKHYIDRYKPKALKGDYQAQRNLAYTYATSRDQFVSNPMLGCAWYQLIILSGSEKIGPGDISNVHVYCGKLPSDEQTVAEQQAKRLYEEIYLGRKRQP